MNNKKGRPCLKRKVSLNPKATYFKPQGIRMFELEVVELTFEELEAVRLKNLKELDQRECAEKMHTSAATFQRILSRANKKIALALIEGRAIRVIVEN